MNSLLVSFLFGLLFVMLMAHPNHNSNGRRPHKPKSSTTSVGSTTSTTVKLNSCPMYPCPQPPPGAPMSMYTVCCSPVRGCGPLLDFTTCDLHNNNCEANTMKYRQFTNSSCGSKLNVKICID